MLCAVLRCEGNSMRDLIERQAAINECNKRGAEHIGYAIAHLPPAQPKIKLVDITDISEIFEPKLTEEEIQMMQELEAAEIDKEYQFDKEDAQPEIIRCKDCKYWQDQEDGVVEVPICARPENKLDKYPFIMIIGKDGFCSFADRRGDRDN